MIESLQLSEISQQALILADKDFFWLMFIPRGLAILTILIGWFGLTSEE